MVNPLIQARIRSNFIRLLSLLELLLISAKGVEKFFIPLQR